MRYYANGYVTSALYLVVLQLVSCQLAFANSILGDFNGSGMRDIEDVDLLHAAIGTDEPIFDLTGDGTVDYFDVEHWLHDLSNTYVGDVNLDGEFNGGDMIIVFAANKFETGHPAKWSEGDWTGDGRFASDDFGNFGGWQSAFERGPRRGGIDLGAATVALGDFNSDGQFTVADIDLLSHVMVGDTYIAKFDLNTDGVVDFTDRQFWIRDIANTFFGDANFDGEVGSEDWIHAFKFAKYETNANAGWEEGDFSGDLRFDSSDFVTVFSQLPDHPGPRAGLVLTVPEPSQNPSLLAAIITTILICRRSRT